VASTPWESFFRPGAMLLGALLMIVLTIAVLAAAVLESRDRVRRDSLVDITTLRSWYEARYARSSGGLDRENLEHALRQAQTFRLWGPVLLSAGTMLTAIALMSLALGRLPGAESWWRTPTEVIDLVPSEVLVQTALVFALLPILVVEGILAALYMADLDIGRLRRLLDSIS
jgi:hypothetical protein